MYCVVFWVHLFLPIFRTMAQLVVTGVYKPVFWSEKTHKWPHTQAGQSLNGTGALPLLQQPHCSPGLQASLAAYHATLAHPASSPKPCHLTWCERSGPWATSLQTAPPCPPHPRRAPNARQPPRPLSFSGTYVFGLCLFSLVQLVLRVYCVCESSLDSWKELIKIAFW